MRSAPSVAAARTLLTSPIENRIAAIGSLLPRDRARTAMRAATLNTACSERGKGKKALGEGPVKCSVETARLWQLPSLLRQALLFDGVSGSLLCVLLLPLLACCNLAARLMSQPSPHRKHPAGCCACHTVHLQDADSHTHAADCPGLALAEDEAGSRVEQSQGVC